MAALLSRPSPRGAERGALRLLLLADFAHVDSLYRIRDALGRGLEDVGEMLIESDPWLEAASFDRERAVRKHVGDYTLFMAGLFPESIARARRASSPRLAAFVDFVAAGKESYAIVSSFDQFEYSSLSRDSMTLGGTRALAPASANAFLNEGGCPIFGAF